MTSVSLTELFPFSKIITQDKPHEPVQFHTDYFQKILSTFDTDASRNDNGVSIVTVIGADSKSKALFTNWLIQYFECEGQGWLESWIEQGRSGEQRGFDAGINWNAAPCSTSDHLLLPNEDSSGVYLWPCVFNLKRDKSPNVLVLYFQQVGKYQGHGVEQLASFLCSRIVEVAWNSQNFKILKQRHELKENETSEQFCNSAVFIVNAENNSSIPRYMTKSKVKEYLGNQAPTFKPALDNFQHLNLGVIKKCPGMLQDSDGVLNEGKIKSGAQHIKNIVNIIIQDIHPKKAGNGNTLTLDTLAQYFQSVVDNFNKHFNLQAKSNPQIKEPVMTTPTPTSTAAPAPPKASDTTQSILDDIFSSLVKTLPAQVEVEKPLLKIDNQLQASACSASDSNPAPPDPTIYQDELDPIGSRSSSIISDSWSRVNHPQTERSNSESETSFESVPTTSSGSDNDHTSAKISYCLWDIEKERTINHNSASHLDQHLSLVFHLTVNKLVVTVALDPNNPMVVLNEFGELATPAVIALTTDHQLVYGTEVVARKKCDDSEATLIKQWSLEDFLCSNQTVVNDVISLNNEHFLISLKTIVGLLFHKLKLSANTEFPGGKYTRAVIAVPSWTPPGARKEIICGGKIAGFASIEIVNDMSACAVHTLMPKIDSIDDNYILLVLSQNWNRLSGAVYAYEQCNTMLALVTVCHAECSDDLKLKNAPHATGVIVGHLVSSLMEAYPSFDISKMECVIMNELQELTESLKLSVSTYFPDITCTVDNQGVFRGARFLERRESLLNVPFVFDDLESYCIKIELDESSDEELADESLVTDIMQNQVEVESEPFLTPEYENIICKPPPEETIVKDIFEEIKETIKVFSSESVTIPETLTSFEVQMETRESPADSITSTNSIPVSTNFVNWDHLEGSCVTLLNVCEAVKKALDSGTVQFPSEFVRELAMDDIDAAFEVARKDDSAEEEIREMINTLRKICMSYNIEVGLQTPSSLSCPEKLATEHNDQYLEE